MNWEERSEQTAARLSTALKKRFIEGKTFRIVGSEMSVSLERARQLTYHGLRVLYFQEARKTVRRGRRIPNVISKLTVNERNAIWQAAKLQGWEAGEGT